MLHSETPMSVSKRALWVIERNLNGDLTLGDIAKACGTSKYHLAHAFGESTRISVMQYVRGRRLDNGLRRLWPGERQTFWLWRWTSVTAPTKAFTRAFRAQFEITPETVRQKEARSRNKRRSGPNSEVTPVRFIIPLTGNMWHKP